MSKSRKIVFFFPSFASSDATAPLGILAVATPLLRAGYQICLIDSTITPNYKKRVLEEVRDALCLGISLVTGPMIRETVEIARAIKEWNPDFPIILGGWHPSLLPTQTLEAPYIDYVVRGQGEDSLLELVNHIEKGSAPDFIAGIGFKRDNKLIFTPERPLKPLVDMPPKAYHLADFDAYEKLCGKRWAMYTSSLACPFNCAYCTNAGVYGRKWNALPAEQFVEETVDLSRRYGLEMLWVVDDNFLVDLDRARAISEGLVRAGSQFKWSIQATTNLTARLSLEDLKLLHKAGLHQICQGAESGSRKVWKAMNKDFQDFPNHLRKCRPLPGRWDSPILQHHLRLPRGRIQRAKRDHQFCDGCVQEISRSRVLDQHLYPVSGRSHHGKDCRAWRTSAGFTGRLGRLFPALYQTPVAERPRSSGTAGHARLSAHRLRSHPHLSGHPHTASPGWHRNASRCLLGGVSTTAFTAFLSSSG